MSELDRCEGLPSLVEVKAGPVRSGCLSRAVQETFPHCVRAVTPRERAARLVIQCPLLSITALPRERLRPARGRLGLTKPTTVEWSQLAVGGRPGLRARQGNNVQRVTSYVDTLMSCA